MAGSAAPWDTFGMASIDLGVPLGRSDSRWRAVLGRDARATFFYAVRSTGIYCRASCPSRRPTRSAVVFFETAAEAERAGFRACRRCRPAAAPEPDAWIARVARACQIIERASKASLAALARRVGGSPYHLQRQFRRVTPRQYAEACRLRRVTRALRHGASVTAAIVDAGYGSSSRFYERAAPKLAMAPTLYRAGGPNLRIRYTIVRSPLESRLGTLLVGTTDRGVCAVRLGASADALVSELAEEFTRARLERDDEALQSQAAQVLALMAAGAPQPSLPVDIQATAFQWRVWSALQAIPRGETRTYGQVAEAIGRPGAARAVARACASNPVALLVPCHRVVPAAGGVGGYRWGADKKRSLLALEAGGASKPGS